ncbi:GNAT family N-acetyltransferase [Paenibacillus terreus]
MMSNGAKNSVQETKEMLESTKEGFQDLESAGLAEDAGEETIAGGKLVKEGNGFVIRGEHGLIGEITYSVRPGTDTWMLDHTYVTPEYRGGDIAKRMLDRVAEEARQEAKKIIPLCSYARIQFERNPGYHDVWQQ